MTLRPITAVGLTFSQILLLAQAPLPPGFVRAPAQPQQQQNVQVPPPQQPPPTNTPAQAAPGQPTPAKPDPAKPAAPAAQTPPPTLAPSTAPPGTLTLQNASLREVIDLLARQLKINYILDPRVNGAVTINTYGETKNMDNRALLDLILRINNAAMIQVGEIYRIVPLSDVQRLPLMPDINPSAITEDDRTMLNLMFLRYATVEELAKLLDQFLGEGGKMWSYAPANLLMIQDSRRNMRRLMELVSLFDNDAFANQRVRLFDIKNGRPSDLAKELEGILKSISLNEKNTPVKLLPIDRINTLVAVAPNAGVFKDIEDWLAKLDIAVEASSGTISNFVYRVRYGFAPTLAMAIMGLYSNNPFFAMSMMMMGGMGGGMMGGMPGMMGGGMYGGGMMGGMPGMYGGGMMGGMPGMMGGGMYGGGMMGGMPGMYGGGMYGGGMGMMPGGYTPTYNPPTSGVPSAPGTPAGGTPPATDLTGSFLGAGGVGGQQPGPRQPRIVPNPFDNTLLIQGTRQEYESISKLLRDIDVPPRQVLIEAKIFEVTLTGAFANGVAAFLQKRGSAVPGGGVRPDPGQVLGSIAGGAINLSSATLVGQSRELLMFLSSQEVNTRARVLSAPSVIATDSVPASINVGSEVPTLSSQAVTGAQENGSSLFANNIQSRNTGVTLNVMARVNPMGIVTMTVNQEVSAPIAPDVGAAIQSPSFSKRTVQTQITLQDGDTIAIGGIINETNGSSSAGVPGLHRIPIVGLAFGSKSITKERTELIIFLTPKVIFDMNNVNEASEELKSRLKQLSKYVRNEM